MHSSFPPANAHVKGAALREFLAWYSAHRGRAGLDAAVASLPAPARCGLAPGAEALGIVPSTWYPASLAGVLLDVVCVETPPPELPGVVREATAYVAGRMIRGVYAAVFRMVATPPRYASHIQRAWRQLHDTGERRVVLVGQGEAESVTWAWAGHHPLLCEVASETMAQVFERMGCRQVVAVRTACVSSGARDCRTALTWAS